MPKLSASETAVCVFGGFLIYLLSAGPMMRLTERYYWIITPDTFGTIYAPVGLLMNVPAFDKSMMWYLDLWEPHEASDLAAGAATPVTKPMTMATAKKSAKP